MLDPQQPDGAALAARAADVATDVAKETPFEERRSGLGLKMSKTCRLASGSGVVVHLTRSLPYP